MTHLDLFSGIGGFTLAAQSVGFETIGFSEIEPYACKVLKKHWPNITNYGDIGNVPAIYADLLTGGPPCQPASIAGKQRGVEDDRWFWPQTVAVVERVKPAFCLFENPTGLITLNRGVEFERVLSALESLGYAVQPIVVPACAVDARHRRDRVWILSANTNLKSGTEQERQHERPENHGGSGANGLASGEIVANPISLRESQSQGSESNQRGRTSNGGEDVSDAASERLQGAELRRSIRQGSGTVERPFVTNCCRWEPEPAIRRVVNGLPNRSHRLRCLGNSIVPKVAEMILRAMLASAQTKRERSDKL